MSADAEILALEKKFWSAIRDKDVKAASALIAPESLVTGAQGASKIDPKIFAKMMDEGKWTLHEFELTGVSVVSPSPDIAVIAYKVSERVSMEGKDMTLEAADSSVWCRKDGKWLCVLHTESVLGDPFGRDQGSKKK